MGGDRGHLPRAAAGRGAGGALPRHRPDRGAAARAGGPAGRASIPGGRLGQAARVSEACGRPANPDSPAQVLRALAASGVRVPSTRSAVLRGVDHPAARLLLEYKELARLHAAHGWAWLDEWVAAGRFRAEY